MPGASSMLAPVRLPVRTRRAHGAALVALCLACVLHTCTGTALSVPAGASFATAIALPVAAAGTAAPSEVASGPAAISALPLPQADPPGLAPELAGRGAPPAVAEAPAGGVSAWANVDQAHAKGVQRFGTWTLGRVLQVGVAVVFVVLVVYFLLVSGRQTLANWEEETHSSEWRPFATAGKQYGSAHLVDDNPWREGSGLVPMKMGGYAPGSPALPPLASSQSRVAPQDWDKLPSWA